MAGVPRVARLALQTGEGWERLLCGPPFGNTTSAVSNGAWERNDTYLAGLSCARFRLIFSADGEWRRAALRCRAKRSGVVGRLSVLCCILFGKCPCERGDPHSTAAATRHPATLLCRSWGYLQWSRRHKGNHLLLTKARGPLGGKGAVVVQKPDNHSVDIGRQEAVQQ